MTYAEKKWGDCSKAVAYQFNFVKLVYRYSADCYDDYFYLCPKCKNEVEQKKDYEYPKSSFPKNKDYYLLDTYDSGVSEKLKNDMLEFGIAESNFRPIYSRKHNEILGYQVTPKNMLPSITENNAERQIFYCEHCKTKKFEVDDSYFDAYNHLGCPVYISKEAFDKMEHINCLDGEVSSYTVIISLELYNYLIEKYPRLECRPVFIGNVKNDPEYKRLNQSAVKND
ncbi:hypothetical protein [Eubacterium sp.]|uniref:hypothetical protein n=1 Tax=Eubacterium sp. TaxID=142586 RepID=UPI0025C21596|nr:hypothetical protein [Eubacterium sp.]